MKHPKILIFALFLLLGGVVACLGFRDKTHDSVVWTDNRPVLYEPIFYCADSLYRYIELAYHGEEDAEAFTIVGTAAYNLRVFDRAAMDSLPAVSLEDADRMLWRAADMHYAPAGLVIHYLDQLGLWHHSIPECDFSQMDNLLGTPNYKKM